MQVAKPHRHHRSPTGSDPFTDPSVHTPSYSSYGVPTLTRTTQPQHTTIAQRTAVAPAPPPKSSSKPHSSSKRTQPPMNRDQVVEAVREAVQVKSVDPSPRGKMGRSHTEMPAHHTSRPSRRSHSQDSGLQVPPPVEKTRSGGRARPAKKGSSHADVIDRLDFSGVGPMFHHDGPFDACAPSRNRHRTKAPMMAWSAVTDADKVALANAQEVQRSKESPYQSPDIYVPYEAPKKKYDAIAEAWGIHEPEPFEDFSAGGGYSRYANGDSQPSSRNGTSRRNRYDDPRPAASRRQESKRNALPPPQPIFALETEGDLPIQANEPPSPNGTPKRNKSIIRRIRNMRDSPNVPVASDAEVRNRDYSPTSSAENSATTHSNSNAHATRPTHRTQTSFLGRLGRAANIAGGRRADWSPGDDDGGYVYVEELPPPDKEKSLPATPPVRDGYAPPEESGGYFDLPDGTGMSPGAGLGRKTSLLKKVKGVVKGDRR